MDVKTFRAGSMQEALKLVRSALGPHAAVLHTREVGSGLMRWLTGSRSVEITATTDVAPPRRMTPRRSIVEIAPFKATVASGMDLEAMGGHSQSTDQDRAQLKSMIADLRRPVDRNAFADLPESLFHVFTDLIEADLHEDLARDLVERLRDDAQSAELADPLLLRARVARMIESDIKTAGPIRTQITGRRLVALVGPTGVGKTTTIAKLAANFRLKEKRRVGLITVDTFRIAAVEQLRTYADIIDLPMEVVSTTEEMRQAVMRLADVDLILMDTAGRSPRDEVKIQELKQMLLQAAPDEVHLVLSATCGASALARTAERFAAVGTTSLLLTKLDEASSLGNLLPLVRASRMPLSYLTNGQNVPDDIEIADSSRLARMMLGLEMNGPTYSALGSGINRHAA